MNTTLELAEGRAANKGDRLVALWEVVSVTVSALLVGWAVSAFADSSRLIAAVPIALALGLMLFSHRQRGESPGSLGFRLDNFISCLRLLILPTLAAIALIVIASWLAGNGLSFRPIRTRLFLVPAWALFQQYALQAYINRRAQLALGPGVWAAGIVAVVFGILHLPSPLLCPLALIGGFVWARVYQEYPNLLALAVSHTLVSWTLSLTIPKDLSHYLRIGFKFFGFDI